MESLWSTALVAAGSPRTLTPPMALFRTLTLHKPSLSQTLPTQILHGRLKSFVSYNYRIHSGHSFPSTSPTSRFLRPLAPFIILSRLHCLSSSAASLAPGGGNGGDCGGVGGGGGGESGGEAGDVNPTLVSASGQELSAVSSDVILLDVRGMVCGGCAASVKRILESQPQVSSASVNLTTETAIVWPVSEAKVVADWKKELGEALAVYLTNCGFKSNLRGEGATGGDISP